MQNKYTTNPIPLCDLMHIHNRFIQNTERHMFDNKEGKSTDEVSNISVWMFYSINNVQCWDILQKKWIGKEKNQSYCKHTQKYKHCPKKQWNVTWVYSIKISTWLLEADNDSCGWYVTKKKELSFLYPVVLQVVCFWGQVVHVVKTMCVSTNMRSQCLNILLQRKKARDKGVK